MVFLDSLHIFVYKLFVRLFFNKSNYFYVSSNLVLFDEPMNYINESTWVLIFLPKGGFFDEISDCDAILCIIAD